MSEDKELGEHMKKAGYEPVEDKSTQVGIRVVQAFCVGMFTLGISMMAGDISGAVHLPVSALSITTTLFGGIGSVMCEAFARKAETEKW